MQVEFRERGGGLMRDGRLQKQGFMLHKEKERDRFMAVGVDGVADG